MSWSRNEKFLLDISHLKGAKLFRLSFAETLKREGVAALFLKAFRAFYYKAKGVDFSPQNLHDLHIKSSFKENASVCNHVLDRSFKEILKRVKEYDPSVCEGAFLDYGSGKGKTLYLASIFGFEKTIGVEFAKELYEISERNLNRLGVKNAKTVFADAAEFIPPSDTRVVFFHNPFDERVFERVLENILKVEFEKSVYIVYHYPLCEKVFEKYKKFKLLERFVSPTSKERSNFYILSVPDSID